MNERGQNMSRCRACGAEIVWIKMRGGKIIPCNAKPIQYSSIPSMPDNVEQLCGGGQVLTLVTPDGDVEHGFFNPESMKIGYISHFATCPRANRFRKGQK